VVRVLRLHGHARRDVRTASAADRARPQVGGSCLLRILIRTLGGGQDSTPVSRGRHRERMAAARRAPPNRGRTGASSSAAHTPRGRQGRSPIFRHAARRRMEVDPHLPGAAYAARPLHQRRFGEQSLARLTGPDSAPFSLCGRPACARASTGRADCRFSEPCVEAESRDRARVQRIFGINRVERIRRGSRHSACFHSACMSS
jgi:hypothetical protein